MKNMKLFRVAYSEDTPVYDIEVEAENQSEAHNKAKNILNETLISDFDIWNVEELKKKEEDEKTINNNK